MKEHAKITVIGGDLRQAFLAEQLASDGHEVTVSALERHKFPPGLVDECTRLDRCLPGADAIALPMPVACDEQHLNAPLSNASLSLDTVLDTISPGTLVLCGAASPAVRARASRNQLRLFDYLDREELAIRNAVPTALSILLNSRAAFFPI